MFQYKIHDLLMCFHVISNWRWPLLFFKSFNVLVLVSALFYVNILHYLDITIFGSRVLNECFYVDHCYLQYFTIYFYRTLYFFEQRYNINITDSIVYWTALSRDWKVIFLRKKIMSQILILEFISDLKG